MKEEGDKYKTLTARVPRALAEAIRRHAESAGLARGEALRVLLSSALADTTRDTTRVTSGAQLDRIERLAECAARHAAEAAYGARVVHKMNKRESTIPTAFQYSIEQIKKAKEVQDGNS